MTTSKRVHKRSQAPKGAWLLLGLFVLYLGVNVLPAYAEGSVVMKLLAINPSEKEEQILPLRAYLPKEAKPEIVEHMSDGIQIEYDATEGAYLIIGDIKLKPGESKVIEVAMTDIWLIGEEKLTDLKDQGEKLFQQLKGTVYESRAEGLFNNVLVLLMQIAETQADSNATPEEHINIYRENMKKIRDIELDLIAMRRFIASAGGKEDAGAFSSLYEEKGEAAAAGAKGEGKGFVPSVKATWKLIFGIMGFIGLIGLISFGIWQRELSKILKTEPPQKEPLQKEPGSSPSPQPVGSSGDRRAA